MSPHVRQFCSSWLALLVVGACSGRPTSNRVTPTPPVPSGFELVLGEGGGFGGLWSGYTILEDGTVSTWRGPVAETGLTPAGHIERDQVASIWADLQAIGFDTTVMDERGEITAFMRVKTDSLEHRVSWIPGAEGVEQPRHPVESLYRNLKKAAMAASETP